MEVSVFSRRAALASFGSAMITGPLGTDVQAQQVQPAIRPVILNGYIAAKARYGSRNSGTGVAVDFGLASNVPRLHIINADNSVQQSFLVGHGKGSDPDHNMIATIFDGPHKSHTSVLGALRGAERYSGNHGLSLRLNGMQSSNRYARSRFIVVHQADYMEARFMSGNNGKPGRSLGCFVLRQDDLGLVLSALEGGGILWAAR